MKAFKILFIYFLRLLTGLIVFGLIYLFFSWLLPYFKVNNSFKDSKDGIEIYVQSNGVHTDIVMPVKNDFFDWSSFLPYSDFESVSPDYRYIAMGWGDKGFYLDTPTWADLKFSTAFKAVFGLGGTAMHVTYKNDKPKTGELCKKVVISKENYKILVGSILSSFQIVNGAPILVKHDGYTSQDRFYEAKGVYHLFRTCNVWTGKSLRAAGIRIGIWTPFHKSIVGHLE